MDSAAIPVTQEYNIRLDFTIYTTNLHYYFHQHVLAPREIVPALATPRLEEDLSLTKFAQRTEFWNKLQVQSLREQRQRKGCSQVSISDIQ